MTSEPTITRRIAQLENDRDSLYELVDDFRTETRTRFDRLEGRLDQHDARFERLEGRLDQHDARFDQHDARFDRIDGTLAEILRRLPELL